MVGLHDFLQNYKDNIAPKHGYNRGCLMVKYHFPKWNMLLKLIDPIDVHEQGLEYETHVTALYGILPEFNRYVDVVRLLSKDENVQNLYSKRGVRIRLGELGVFENEDFDVLKIGVYSSDLKYINKLLKDNLENDNKYPDYKAHITLAYLKKGAGKKYKKLIDINNYLPDEAVSYDLLYSEPSIIDVEMGNVGKLKHTLDIRTLNKKLVVEMAKKDLDLVDKAADDALGIDVEFTRHFFDRVNDRRNGKPITKTELIDFFDRLGEDKERLQSFLDKYKSMVVKDNKTKINIPFVNKVNKIIAKTVMRKKNFKTSDVEFVYEDY